MPRSYGNISVRAAARAAVADWLTGNAVRAWIGPDAEQWTAFSEPASDAFDLAKACELAISLTGDLGAAAIVAAIHNGDVLGILAVEKGRHVASYISYPGIFAEGPPPAELKPEITGSAGMLAALGVDSDAGELERVLAVGTPEPFVYPAELHAAFVRTFDLPEYTLSFGYAEAEAGRLPGAPAGFARIG